MNSSKEFRLKGSCISEGIAIGVLFFLPAPTREIVSEHVVAEDLLDLEVGRYYKALEKSKEDLLFLQFNLRKEGAAEALSIIETHIQMLEDPLLTICVEEGIRTEQKNAEVIFHGIIKEYQAKFSLIQDPFFQQRIVDVLDLSKRVLDHLMGKSRYSFSGIPQNSVIFTKELIPSHLAAIQASRVGAFVTQQGGGSSHAALIAKAKGVPYVSDVDIESIQKDQISSVIVDGEQGEVIFYPQPDTLKKYKKLKTQIKTTYQLLQQDLYPVTETIDGYAVRVYGTAGNVADLKEMHKCLPEAIGLFRSEYLFLEKNIGQLSEEEQIVSYSEIVKYAKGLPLVIRVFDIGGDKNPNSVEEEHEISSVLGCRGIRFLLRHPKIFYTQLRAIMRACKKDGAKILLPLVSDLQEVLEAKTMIKQVQSELVKEGLIGDVVFSIGCMIEVPSAALLCDEIAQHVDFLSIGTNDLVQYTLGMDRRDPSLGDFFSPLHPSVIRMIKMIVMAAKRQNKPLTICGEMGSDPSYIPLLLGLGVNEVSCCPHNIPLVKKAVRNCLLLSTFRLAQKALTMSSHHAVARLLEDFLQKKDRKESIPF